MGTCRSTKRNLRQSMLVKKVNKDSDKDMEDVEGSNKRRAVYGIAESTEAVDQPRRQQ